MQTKRGDSLDPGPPEMLSFSVSPCLGQEENESGRLKNADLSIYHDVALPVARRSAEVAWRLPCSASNTHDPLTQLKTAEWWPPWPVLRTRLFFFSCEGKHFTVLDTDSHSLEGHSPWRFEPVLMGLHRSGHYQPRLEMLLGLSR